MYIFCLSCIINLLLFYSYMIGSTPLVIYMCFL